MTTSKLQLVTTSPEKEAALLQIRAQIKGNTSADQRHRLMTALRRYAVTTFEAMRLLDIYHPPARIKELRQEGHDIQTVWVNALTEAQKPHRVGMYVLRNQATQKERATNGEVGGSMSKSNTRALAEETDA